MALTKTSFFYEKFVKRKESIVHNEMVTLSLKHSGISSDRANHLWAGLHLRLCGKLPASLLSTRLMTSSHCPDRPVGADRIWLAIMKLELDRRPNQPRRLASTRFWLAGTGKIDRWQRAMMRALRDDRTMPADLSNGLGRG
jgi:hypothetical protein